MSEFDKGMLLGFGLTAGLLLSGWVAMRANWPGVKQYLAANIDGAINEQLASSTEARAFVPPVSAIIQTITGKTLQQQIHENLSIAVANGLGDALKIRTDNPNG